MLILLSLGRTLEETAAIFDGEDQEQVLTYMGGDAATMTMSRAVALQEQSIPADVSDDSLQTSDKESEIHYPISTKLRESSGPGVSFQSRDVGRAL